MLYTRHGAVPAVMAAVIASSEEEPAGISWAVTCASGWSPFQASTTACPQSSSCSLLDSQTVIGPVPVGSAPSPSPPPPDPPPPAQPAATRATPTSRTAVRGYLISDSSLSMFRGEDAGASTQHYPRAVDVQPARDGAGQIGEEGLTGDPAAAGRVGGHRGQRWRQMRRQVIIIES